MTYQIGNNTNGTSNDKVEPMKVTPKPTNSYEYQRGYNDGYAKALEYVRIINEIQEMGEKIRSGEDE